MFFSWCNSQNKNNLQNFNLYLKTSVFSTQGATLSKYVAPTHSCLNYANIALAGIYRHETSGSQQKQVWGIIFQNAESHINILSIFQIKTYFF